MKKFRYYFFGSIALLAIWSFVILPLIEYLDKPEKREFTEPSVILGRDDINDEAAFFKEWRDRGKFSEYNPMGYQYHKNIYNSQTGRTTYEPTGLVYIVEKSLYDEMVKYNNYKFVYLSDLGDDIRSQMNKCRETNTSPCRLTLKESLIQ